MATSPTNLAGSPKALARFFARIEEKTKDRAAAPVLIVAMGDSVTQGIAGVDELLHGDVYHALFKAYLEQTFPLCVFSVINAGVDGQRMQDGLERMDRDVVRHQPDLVLVAFGLNDAALDGPAGLGVFRDKATALIERVRSETQADVILLTPNHMLTKMNSRIPEIYAHIVDLFMDIQSQGTIGDYASELVEVGQLLDVPVADVYGRWEALEAEGRDTTAMLANGLNHPDNAGHILAAAQLISIIERLR